MNSKIKFFLERHRINPSQETNRSYIFDCPSCGGHKKLYIQKEDGLSVCFKGKTDNCPKPGSKPEYALSLLSQLPIEIVRNEIVYSSHQLGDEINLPDLDNNDKIEEKILKNGSLPIDIKMLYDPSTIDGINYLQKRGIPLEVGIKYNIMYSPGHRRVIFPVIMNNVLYGWQGRAIDPVDKAFRMYNMEGDWRAHTLMFYENLLNSNHVIIAEGPISALKFEKVGGFIATMGKEISQSQLDLIIKSGIKNIYLALDRDAFDKLDKIRHYLIDKSIDRIKIFIIDIPKHRDDFGDCTFDECEKAFNEAKELNGDDLFAHIEVKLSDSKKA